MTLAVTAMVRDEADVVRQWVQYHVAQGVDVIIVTDNASTDGTTEVLREFEAAGTIVLHHDPVHRKQQGSVVTAMAREAATVFGADWVINADADEFIVPVDRSLRLSDVFARLDPAIGSFGVPVVNLVGSVAESGAGFERLVWRDERTNEQLQLVGVLAQPTTNAVHVGDPDVTVVQGNHMVSVASNGHPPDDLALEVLHLPWRSWRQFRHKVELAGAGYAANPDLTPSPNHHGMRDYARLQEGTLLPYYAGRHVSDDEAMGGPFTKDDTIPTFFGENGIDLGSPDERVDDARAAELAVVGRALVARELEIVSWQARLDEAVAAAAATESELRRQHADLEGQLAELRGALQVAQDRKVVKLLDTVAARVRRR
jgi:hypothetical protein